MSAYGALAESYDRLTRDVDYDQILAYAQELLAQSGLHPHSVLDLACGTGSMSLRLAQAGYQVIGADLSEEMLTMAFDKAVELDSRPIFICQSMERLHLPAPVDWIFCGLDSINYLVNPADCRETFRRVFQSLKPGGVFLFDVNTPEKLKAMDGQVFLDEDADVYCVWRSEYEPEERICYYGMDLFQRRGALWQRSFEEHREYAYELDEIQMYLRQAGFAEISCFGDRSLEPPQPDEQRVYWKAVRRET